MYTKFKQWAIEVQKVTRLAIISSLFLVLGGGTGFAQADLYGSWQGKMKSANGARYVFNLDILSSPNDGQRAIKGVAIHDRNGEKEVIELKGIMYSDYSIYFSDVLDRFDAVNQGKRVSKLQFLLKYEGGDPMLDGHWQEYRDLRSYRKGRLVLRKKKNKA